MAILGRVIREGLPQGGHLSKGQKEVRGKTTANTASTTTTSEAVLPTSGGKDSRQRERQVQGP